MASSIINSDDGVVSGTSGLKTTGGDDGVLVFQSKGTETARINTDSQIVAAAGTASLPALTTTGDVNTGIFFPAADTIGFAEGGAEAMRITSDGRLGIGTSSPAQPLEIASATGGTIGLRYISNSGYATIGTDANNQILFSIGNPPSTGERMRIDNSGNLLVGKTAPDNSERLGVKSSGNTSSTYGMRVDNSSATAILMIRDDGYLRSPTTYNLTGGTANLSIDSSGFITRSTSSLRYKRDIETYTKGLNAVATLRPVFYKSSVIDASGNLPDTQFAGLIAEELHEAGFSEFVEYNEQGQPDAVRYGNMVSLCVKAIQELSAKNDALEARIAALEAVPGNE